MFPPPEGATTMTTWSTH